MGGEATRVKNPKELLTKGNMDIVSMTHLRQLAFVSQLVRHQEQRDEETCPACGNTFTEQCEMEAVVEWGMCLGCDKVLGEVREELAMAA